MGITNEAREFLTSGGALDDPTPYKNFISSQRKISCSFLSRERSLYMRFVQKYWFHCIVLALNLMALKFNILLTIDFFYYYFKKLNLTVSKGTFAFENLALTQLPQILRSKLFDCTSH